MKKLSVVSTICILIFTLFVGVTAAMAGPLTNRLRQGIGDSVQKLSDELSKNTGLSFSYESISPSILTGININNIQLNNEKGETVLAVRKTQIDYKLLEVIKGNYTGFIRGTVVDGVEIHVSKLLDAVSPFINPTEKKDTAEVPSFDLNSITEYFPGNVSVKNINLLYEDENLNALVAVKKISLFSSTSRKSFDFQFDSYAELKIKALDMNASCVLGANGTIYTNLNNSFVYFNISDLNNGIYKLNKTNLMVTYNDNKFNVHTIQSIYPLNINASYDLKSEQLTANLKADNLNPMSVISTNQNSELIKIIKNFRATLEAAFDFNLKTNKISYSTSGKVKVPDSLIKGGAVVSLKLSGNDKNLNVQSLAVNGKLCDANMDLHLDYKTLQLFGSLQLDKFVLPNGKIVSSELYFDPLSSGFRIFAPEVLIGNRALTALLVNIHPQKESVDFEMEISDYSRFDAETAGKLEISGSYLMESNYIQTNVSAASIYIQSLVELIAEFTDKNTSASIKDMSNALEPYVFSCDAYLSTDLSSISYNVTNLVVADTSADNRVIFLSVNGNEASVQLNRFDAVYDAFAVNASASLDIDYDEKEVFFTTDLNAGSVPYHFMGTINSSVIKVNGDYGIDAELRLAKGLTLQNLQKSKNSQMEGYANIGNLPIVFGPYAMIISMDSQFNYTKEMGPEVILNFFEIEETDSVSSLNPKLAFSGSGTKYGAQLNSVSYSDSFSSLQGAADVTINSTENSFDSLGANVRLKNILSDEEIELDVSVSNPENLPLTIENLKENIYMNIFAGINHFSLNRFTSVKNNNNEISATLSLSGTYLHPFATVNITNMNMLMGNDFLSASGSATLEEKDVSVNEFSVYMNGMNINNFSGDFALDSLTGAMKFDISMGDNAIKMPVELQITDTYVPEGKVLPENMVITLSSNRIEGSVIQKPVGFSITALYTPGEIDFFSSENMGLYGTYMLSSGEIFASLHSGELVSAEVMGTMNGNSVALFLNDIHGDAKGIADYFDFNDMVKIEKGEITGNLFLGGNFDTPEFGGEVDLLDVIIDLPTFVSDKVTADKMVITADGNEIFLQDSVLKIKNVEKLIAGMKISFNKWILDSMSINAATIKNQSIPLKYISQWVNVTGDINCDLALNFENNNWDIRGKVSGEKIDAVSSLQDVTTGTTEMARVNKSAPENLYGVTTDIEVFLGTHVMLNFNPLLRCILAPNTKLGLKIDSNTGTYQVDGQVNLKSGDVAYFNRSFYIKSGSIKFNPDEISNPQITIQAETRERDDKNQTVRIILSAENQYVQNFNPRFTSVPAKSEAEIRSLLGQIVLADSDSFSDLIFSAGDYYIQSTVMRSIENKLREVLNFDIFSVRTNVLQNTLNLGVSGNLTGDSITLGNFLDNSTVYIGKYLGSVLYIDAMMHLTQDGKTLSGINNSNSLLFQPEFGLELELPVVNIRWSMAPDINALINHQYVPANSLSLSWKFSF
ncbi:MAG: translocation/assembly module TamB [Treponema sp.]|nr:translocation/assembly module TamB [Treponema sp.]